MTPAERSNLRRVALDTNAVIYYLDRREPYRSWLRPLVVSMAAGDREFVLSVVVDAELRVKPLRDGDAEALRQIDALIATPAVEIVPVTVGIARRAATIRSDTDLALPDSIVIASAIASGCDALIGNDRTCARRVTEIPYVYLDEAIANAGSSL
jgi:predicted nucleic acid-binding protein